ncbi:MAG: hypothetical protein LBD28_00795 [Tannerellaceae bacterium]|jgi:hypothetical protein|nr:hypothetical protein [Tannerellaceae bacterium]
MYTFKALAFIRIATLIAATLIPFAALSQLQPAPLIVEGTKILFVGNDNVGSDGGLNNHIRRSLAAASAPLRIEADWIGMYDKPSLEDMFTDSLLRRIETGSDDLLVVTSGSSDAMLRFAALAKTHKRKIIFFQAWAKNPLVDSGGMKGFRDRSLEEARRMKALEREHGLRIVPVGLIYYDLIVDPVRFWTLREDYLFTPGSSVQNDLGILVNVAAIYAAANRQSPVGLPSWDPFPSELVRAMQERVWRISREWDAGIVNLKPIPDKYAEPLWTPLVQNADSILFIGNSYIGSEGGLDNHLSRMSQQMNPPLRLNVKSIIHWGQGLGRMYNDSVLKEIATGGKQLVVVTSGPNELLLKFAEAISKAGSKMMVHMTWATNPTLNENDLIAYRERSQRLAEQMKAFETTTGIAVAPCGLVFYDLLIDPPAVEGGLRLDWMYMEANIHQNHIGTMINAATHYAVMTGRSPVGLPIWDPWPPKLVREVQERAWKIVKEWKAGHILIKDAPKAATP